MDNMYKKRHITIVSIILAIGIILAFIEHFVQQVKYMIKY